MKEEISLVEYWTCFEGLSLNSDGYSIRKAIQYISSDVSDKDFDTFLWKKSLEKTHTRQFDCHDKWLDFIKVEISLPGELRFLTDQDLNFSFEQVCSDEVLLTTLRFLCPKTGQPYCGHVKYRGFDDSNLMQWALLQIRSECLHPSYVASRLFEILQVQPFDMAWTLSRRGGISYQGSTYQKPYERSIVE